MPDGEPMEDPAVTRIENRLAQIERSLGALSEAMISLARVEERQAFNASALDRLESRTEANVSNLYDRIRPLERLRWLGIGVATGAGAVAGALSSVIPWQSVLA